MSTTAPKTCNRPSLAVYNCCSKHHCAFAIDVQIYTRDEQEIAEIGREIFNARHLFTGADTYQVRYPITDGIAGENDFEFSRNPGNFNEFQTAQLNALCGSIPGFQIDLSPYDFLSQSRLKSSRAWMLHSLLPLLALSIWYSDRIRVRQAS